MSRPDLSREQTVGRLQRELDARFEIVLALLHGSFPAGGTYRDIDVAVWLDPIRLSRGERFRYAVDLSAPFHVPMASPIDVPVLNYAPLAVSYQPPQVRPPVGRAGQF